MNKKNFTGAFFIACMILGGIWLYSSCGTKIQTPPDTKYLEEFHMINFNQQDKLLDENCLALYVDYSTCTMLGQNSAFFQALEPTFTQLATKYYSIKGRNIKEENLQDSTAYLRLRNINEVNYAELKQAADQIAKCNSEAVFLTDGEYYTQNTAKGHDNDPWLADALKTWILKGHDIHIISEPYLEGAFSKKRFYILFTDDRNPNNVYERILRTVDLTQFPDVDEFHISASHPQMKGNRNNCSTQDQTLLSKSKGYGTFEIQDWDGCDWETIENLLVNVYDDQTGEPLEEGATIMQLGLDKNSFGCYRIKSVNLKVYDINQEYNNYYELKESGGKPGHEDLVLSEYENFMEFDSVEFSKHSKINIRFKKDWFDPSILVGKPYNYFKIDVAIGDVQSIFVQHEEKFEFESISKPGTKNVSVASSIKQCLADDKILNKMRNQVIYSIYIKSEPY